MRNKERKGKRQDPRQSRERERSKVRVLGFKNAYRLERVSCIKEEKKKRRVVDPISSNSNYLELRFLKSISLQGNLGLCQ